MLSLMESLGCSRDAPLIFFCIVFAFDNNRVLQSVEEKVQFLLRTMDRQNRWRHDSYRVRRAHVEKFVRVRGSNSRHGAPANGAEALPTALSRAGRLGRLPWRQIEVQGKKRGAKSGKPQRCSICGGIGHNKSTCKARADEGSFLATASTGSSGRRSPKLEDESPAEVEGVAASVSERREDIVARMQVPYDPEVAHRIQELIEEHFRTLSETLDR